MSLCGPTTALNKLSQHSQVDRSLHQDAQRSFTPQSQGFKSHSQNHQLDLEFQQHQQFQQSFNPIFANAFGKAPAMSMNRPAQQHPVQQQQHQQPKASWANDFNAMNHMNHPQQHHNQQHQYTTAQGWNTDFQSFQQHAQQPSIATPRSFTNLTQLSGLNMTQASIPSFQRTEHQELHQQDLLNQELESEFMKLEQEFQNTSLQEQQQAPKAEAPVFKRSNSDFANAAMQVVEAMNSQQSTKFQNSKFLSLMNLVSKGEVELNDTETKLIDQEGNDIQELENNTSSHLPDPLEGIKNGELHTPFQSAQLAGENFGEKYTWDDVYDDYKNDDDSF